MAKRITDQESNGGPVQDDTDFGPISEGAAIVASGHTLMKMENDTMSAVSIARPRNEDAVLAGALDELERYPDLAARNYYSIPYKESRGSDRKVYVEGPSIQAAMSLARRWGNCITRAIQVTEDEECVHLSGVFLDLESNFRVERPFAVSKLLKRRGGAIEVLRDQRLMMAMQAGASKAMRNAILSGLPDGLVEAYYQRARSIAAREAKTKWAEIISGFRQFGVSQEMLEDHIGHKLEGISENELADLRGIFNSLKDGQAQPSDIFGKRRTDEPEATRSVEDVVGKGAEVTGGAEQTAPPPIPSEGVIGEAGAVRVIDAAVKRSTKDQIDATGILSAVAQFFNVADVTAIPEEHLAKALELVATADFITDDDEQEQKPAPVGPPNEEVSKGGDTRPKQEEEEPPPHDDASAANVPTDDGQEEMGF